MNSQIPKPMTPVRPASPGSGASRPAEFSICQAGAAVALRPPERTPVIAPGVARFVWQGKADAVYLRHFMSQGPNGFALRRLPGSDLWTLDLCVPDNARFEYKFDIVRGGKGHWINDPLNPDLATDPFGANSVCMTHGYSVPAWSYRDPETRGGEVENFVLPDTAFAEPRGVSAYLPAGYDSSRRYPLVVIHDGWDYIDHASLVPALDNLIAAGDLPPLVAALTQSPDRNSEYVDDPKHSAFVADDLLPAFENRYSLDPDPHRRAIMGASLGAVASLSVASRVPELFGGGVLKSGSFIFDPTLLKTRSDLFARVNAFLDSLGVDDRHLRRAFVCCGRYEGLVTQNRRMAAELRRSGVATRYVEGRDAHHWHAWRDQIRAGLRWCLHAPARTPFPNSIIQGE